MIDSIDAAGRDEAVRVILISGAGDHFCSGFDIVSRNADDGTRPRVGSIQRRLPSQAHRLIPLILNTQTPVVCRGAGVGRGDRPQPRAGRRLRRRRRRRAVLDAVRRPRLHARQRRHLAAAASHRRGARARDAPARPGRRRRGGGGLGDVPPDRARRRPRRRTWTRSWRSSPGARRSRVGLDEVAAEQRARDAADRAPSATRPSRWSCRRGAKTSAKVSPRSARSAIPISRAGESRGRCTTR